MSPKDRRQYGFTSFIRTIGQFGTQPALTLLNNDISMDSTIFDLPWLRFSVAFSSILTQWPMVGGLCLLPMFLGLGLYVRAQDGSLDGIPGLA